MDFEEIIKEFKPITMDEMKSVRLMNRTDTKYIFHVNRLNSILPCPYAMLYFINKINHYLIKIFLYKGKIIKYNII